MDGSPRSSSGGLAEPGYRSDVEGPGYRSDVEGPPPYSSQYGDARSDSDTSGPPGYVFRRPAPHPGDATARYVRWDGGDARPRSRSRSRSPVRSDDGHDRGHGDGRVFYNSHRYQRNGAERERGGGGGASGGSGSCSSGSGVPPSSGGGGGGYPPSYSDRRYDGGGGGGGEREPPRDLRGAGMGLGAATSAEAVAAAAASDMRGIGDALNFRLNPSYLGAIAGNGAGGGGAGLYRLSDPRIDLRRGGGGYFVPGAAVNAPTPKSGSVAGSAGGSDNGKASPERWGLDGGGDRSPSPQAGRLSSRMLRQLHGESSDGSQGTRSAYEGFERDCGERIERASTVASIDVHPPSSAASDVLGRSPPVSDDESDRDDAIADNVDTASVAATDSEAG